MENKHIGYQMQLYVTLVRAGSFTQAAEQLGITRSWLSQQISGLEKSLNTLLLHRTTRTLRMTDSGERFFEHAVAMENLLEKAQEDISSTQSGIKGKVRISCPTALAPVLVVPAIKTLRCEHPELDIELVVTDTIQDLLQENIDVAIRVGNLPDSNLKARLLGRFHQRWYQSPELPEGSDDQILLPWQTPEHANVLRVNNILTAAEMAKQGLGRVLLPDLFARSCCEQGLLTLVSRAEPEPEQQRDVHAIHAFSEFTPARIRLVIDTLISQFQLSQSNMG
ncbi:LysR family transcriptional regulator [Grimontia sp. AD028]|uniref:LysR family transcriptional regulator n=1 Tax=Grimontia sp. AD028 TaxID=1581149 RepID=UPI0006966197|nr:LysR family transcriptional regulator [Grimontia sp. AD028]